MSTIDIKELPRFAVELAQKKGAAQVAAGASRSRQVDVKWRDGKLDTITEATSRSLGLALYVEGRYSSVATSDLRPSALEQFIEDAVAMARALEPDAHRQLPDPELYRGRTEVDLELLDPRQEALTPDERRSFAQELEAAARTADERGDIVSVTSNVGDAVSDSLMVTSNGFEGSQRTTLFWASAEVSAKDKDGRRPEEYDFANVRFREDSPSAADLGRRAGERALGRLGSTKGKSEALTMVVENRAGGRLVSMLNAALAGVALQQKRSFLEGKLGTQIGSALLDITDDPFIKRGLGSRRFDSEGIAARPLPIFERGVLRTFYIDNYYGRKLGQRPTTGRSSNVSFGQGTQSREGLIAAAKEGIFVTGFLGGNANSATGDFSLGVNGYRIRNGQLAEPVSEMNIAGNQLDFWRRLVAVGNDPFAYSSVRMPTLVFESVQFAGT